MSQLTIDGSRVEQRTQVGYDRAERTLTRWVLEIYDAVEDERWPKASQEHVVRPALEMR